VVLVGEGALEAAVVVKIETGTGLLTPDVEAGCTETGTTTVAGTGDACTGTVAGRVAGLPIAEAGPVVAVTTVAGMEAGKVA